VDGVEKSTMSLETTIDTQKTREMTDKLSALDWSPVDRRLERRTGDAQYVAGLKQEAMRFLGIAATGQGAYAPSQKVDEYWHEMVLHTPLYGRVTEQAGGFVHHNPSDRPEVESYKRTLETYRAVFGEPSGKYWKKDDAADCDAECNANTCDTTGPDWLRAPRKP
jgi:hypothetical protein